MIGSSI